VKVISTGPPVEILTRKKSVRVKLKTVQRHVKRRIVISVQQKGSGFELSVIVTFIATLILILIYFYNTNHPTDFTFTHYKCIPFIELYGVFKL